MAVLDCKMRVLLINHTPLEGSGSGTYTAGLRSSLRARGHAVAALVPNSAGESSGADYTFDVPFGRFPSFTGHPASSVTYDALQPRELSKLVDTWTDVIGDVVHEFDPDIVHVQHFWIPFEATRRRGCAAVVTCHGSEIAMLRRHRFLYGRRYLSDIELPPIICVSRFVREQLTSEIAVPAGNGILLRNPYNATLFSPSDGCVLGPVRVGFVGRLVPYKRADFFLRLAGVLLASRFADEFVVVGDGPCLMELRTMADQLGLSGFLRFRGSVPHENMPDIYRSLAVLVTCAESEPFGLTAVEAAACGTPVVVPRSGGLGELEHDPFILGYEAGDLLSAEFAIRQAVSAGGRLRSEGRLGRADHIRKNFGPTTYIYSLEEIYESVVRRSSKGKI